MNIPCPSCGFLTIEEETYGTYNICSVCGWEDDQVQLANPCTGGGANSESLYESQMKSIKKWPLKIKDYQGFKRSEKWRPLDTDEIKKYQNQAKEEPWNNEGVLYESETYWAKNS
jgi:hypothetical protein